jgi:hypothetical protein
MAMTTSNSIKVKARGAGAASLEWHACDHSRRFHNGIDLARIGGLHQQQRKRQSNRNVMPSVVRQGVAESAVPRSPRRDPPFTEGSRRNQGIP